MCVRERRRESVCVCQIFLWILIFIQKIKMVPEAREEGGMREAPKPLYGRMMKAIRSGHTFGNRVRMLKVRLS